MVSLNHTTADHRRPAIPIVPSFRRSRVRVSRNGRASREVRPVRNRREQVAVRTPRLRVPDVHLVGLRGVLLADFAERPSAAAGR